MVYIREAHPIDGDWPLYRVLVEQPLTNKERKDVAQTCISNLDLGGMPAVMDGIDDRTSLAYQAYPDRLYLVGRNGKITYAGGPGPQGFKPQELEAAIRRELHMSAEGSTLAANPAAAGPLPPAGAPRGPRQLAIMRILDSDGDGRLSAEELAAATEALLKLDTDGDGSLSPRELTLGGQAN